MDKKNQRQHKRHRVFGGHAKITAVMGRGHQPGEPARIADWSRGGLSLRVKSPRRKLLFLKQEDCLYEGDTVYLDVHVPPRYESVSIKATVVHLEREGDDLAIGVAVCPETPEKTVAKLAQSLEPRSRSSRRQRVSA